MIHHEHLSMGAMIAWPFEDGAPLLARGRVPNLFADPPVVAENLVVDAVFTVPTTITEVRLAGIDFIPAPVMRFTDQDDTPLFAVTVPEFTARYYRIALSNPVREAHGQLVLSYAFWIHLAQFPPETALTYAAFLLWFSGYQLTYGSVPRPDVEFGYGLPFCPDTIRHEVRKLITLQLFNGPPTGTPSSPEIAGDVTVYAGYNMALERNGQEWRIDAEAGAGAGRYPCDEQAPIDPVVKLLTPDGNGNVEIEGDDCYNVVPIPASGTILLEHRCDPCCGCESYIDIGGRLNTLADEFKTHYETIKGVRDAIAQAVLDRAVI